MRNTVFLYVRSSISAQLVLATASVALITFVLGAVISITESRRSVEMSASAMLTRISHSRSQTVADWFDAKRVLIETIDRKSVV